MIRNYYLLPALLFAFVLTACSETEDPGKYVNWRERNEMFMDSLAQIYNSETDLTRTLHRVRDERNKNSYIYYKIIESGPTLANPPYYTSKVTMFYRGMLLNEGVFSTAEAPDYFVTKLFSADGIDIFDQNFSGSNPSDTDSPTIFGVNSVIAGWSEVLLRMRPKDRFEVYIPYQSGYGTSASSSGIMGYSTLIFDMRIEKIEYYPKD